MIGPRTLRSMITILTIQNITTMGRSRIFEGTEGACNGYGYAWWCGKWSFPDIEERCKFTIICYVLEDSFQTFDRTGVSCIRCKAASLPFRSKWLTDVSYSSNGSILFSNHSSTSANIRPRPRYRRISLPLSSLEPHQTFQILLRPIFHYNTRSGHASSPSK
jgi:hypothetical protein